MMREIPTPLKTALGDAAHPAHAAASEFIEKLKAGAVNLCACMGPMYGEPHCICSMERLGLPLNTAARAAEAAKSGETLGSLFGPGGIFYKKSKATS